MKTYRCKQAVEALRWTDTDANRETFAAWFEKHGFMFETRGAVVVSLWSGTASEGDWILYFDDDDHFVPMSDTKFREAYEEVA